MIRFFPLRKMMDASIQVKIEREWDEWKNKEYNKLLTRLNNLYALEERPPVSEEWIKNEFPLTLDTTTCNRLIEAIKQICNKRPEITWEEIPPIRPDAILRTKRWKKKMYMFCMPLGKTESEDELLNMEPPPPAPTIPNPY
jgi:hypothetical protein